MITIYQDILNPIFNLKGDVGIMLKPRIRINGDKNKECWGYYYDTRKGYTPWKFKHKIKLATDNVTDEQLFCVLAHEYVHVWQTENFWFTNPRRIIDNKDLEHSEKTGFMPWVRYFKKEFDVDIVNM